MRPARLARRFRWFRRAQAQAQQAQAARPARGGGGGGFDFGFCHRALRDGDGLFGYHHRGRAGEIARERLAVHEQFASAAGAHKDARRRGFAAAGGVDLLARGGLFLSCHNR